MKFIKLILIIISCTYLAVIALIYFDQRGMLYHPHKSAHDLAYYNIDNAIEITLITKDNVRLQAWFRRPDANQEMIVFLHGNAGNLENRVDKLKQLTEMGYGFIIPAWRGFGKSEGSPTKEGLYLDAEAAIDYIKAKDYKLSQTIMIGESLGTGIATEMALKYKFKGLFLITPYTSIADRAAELYPFMFAKYLAKDNFKVLDNIAKIDQPLFMIHGTKDVVVPYEHSERIFVQAKEPKKLIIYPGIGHNNYDIKEVFAQMQKFFSQFH